MVAPLVTIGPAKTSLDGADAHVRGRRPTAGQADGDELVRERAPDGEADRSRRASGVRDVAEQGAPAFAVTLSLFFLSGATALIDQLCFSKYLSYVVGSTAYAVSAVLAAFMTGLALGAQLGGRVSARIRRPLYGYGLLELVVAVSVALSPLAFDGLTRLYVGLARSAPESLVVLSGVRWLMAMLLVVIPTTAMGATLPLLARSLAQDSSQDELKQRRLAALYATNTLGGAIGALLGAYAILPALGISGTLFASALVSALVGVLAIGLGRQSPARVSEPESAPSSDLQSLAPVELDRGARSVLAGLAFASGFLVFAAEVVFTHLLALIIGNSAYAFGLILAIFLLCLYLGASRAAAFQRRFGGGALGIGLAASALGLSLTLPIWDRLPAIFGGLGEIVRSFGAREATRAFVCLVVLLVPTTLMGLTFPLLLQRVACLAEVGKFVGRLTAINTIGAVSGSLITGYLLLPALGSQRAIVAIALAFAAAALITPAAALRHRAWALALGGALVALIAPRWDLMRLTSGTNVYFDTQDRPDELLFLVEDVHGGVTSVTRLGRVHTLYTNGKFQGNDGWELNAQRYFAHYPAPFVRRMHSALVIGLGTGTTLGTLATYPWQRIDLVEISPSIVRAARTYFRGPNRDVLADPRVRLKLGDGRNFLLVSDARYDLICMELSSVWFAGAGNLYSQQFYRLASDHLEPGGVLQQWVQLHHIRTRDFAAILHTLRLEFAHVALLYGGGQGILLASQQPLSVSDAGVRKLSELPGVSETVPDGRSLAELAGDTLVTGKGLERFVEDTARQEGAAVDELVSNDDNLYLEYATPRGNVLPWSSRDELIARLLNYRDNDAIAAMWGP